MSLPIYPTTTTRGQPCNCASCPKAAGSTGQAAPTPLRERLERFDAKLISESTGSIWQVHLRHVDDMTRPKFAGDVFIQMGTHPSPTAPLRVAVIASQVSLLECRARLPKDLVWDDFEWHEVLNLPVAQAWLTQHSSKSIPLG